MCPIVDYRSTSASDPSYDVRTAYVQWTCGTYGVASARELCTRIIAEVSESCDTLAGKIQIIGILKPKIETWGPFN